MEDGGSEGEKKARVQASVNLSPRDMPNQSCLLFSALFLSLLSAFLFHSPHGHRTGWCFYLLATGAAPAVTGHCCWMCVRNAAAWLYTSAE